MTKRHTCLFFSSMIFLSFKGLIMRTFFSSFGFAALRFAGLSPQAEGSQSKGRWAEKGEGEVARGRSNRVAKFLCWAPWAGGPWEAPPWGSSSPLTQGGWQDQRLVQPGPQQTWIQAGFCYSLGREALPTRPVG